MEVTPIKPRMILAGCGDCICRNCLLYREGRCPRGHCFDDFRAKQNPYPFGERRSWSDWAAPGEQAHWCRGGAFYPADNCADYREHHANLHLVQDCLDSVIEKFEDGYIKCSLIETIGCEECYKRWEERTDAD